MAEKSSEKGFLARTASITTKRAKRAQEKVMQKLGKANETKDSTYDEFVINFNKQQAAAQRLQKEFKNYTTCIKAMLSASQAFGEAVKEVYEPDWHGTEQLTSLLEQIDTKWNDLLEKLQEEVLVPLTAYQCQFPDIKARINKRGRKIVDYDRAKHNLEALKAKGKNVDPKKLAQAEEEFNEARNVYSKLHVELYDELPALYDSRIAFYVSSFQSIFTAEGVFHREAAKMKTQLNDLMDGVVEQLAAGTHSTRKPCPLTGSDNPISDSDEAEVQSQPHSDAGSGHADICNDEGSRPENGEVVLNPYAEEEQIPLEQTESKQEKPVQEAEDIAKQEPVSRPSPPVKRIIEKPTVPPLPAARPQTLADSSAPSATDTADSPQSPSTTPTATPASTPTPSETPAEANDEVPGMLYKVRATHKYVAEDDDELTFEKGEIIYVIPFEDPEDQDEGWLMGVLHSSKMKGVFPANFTKRLP